MSAFGSVLAFLLEHVDLITAIKDAIESGAKKEEVLRAIKASMVAASDAQMRAELGGPSQ